MRNLKFLSLFLFVFSIFSCSPFTASISDYYNKYTESAGLLDVEYPENSIFSNKIQLNCVGSDADSIINLNLFNSKKLNMQIVFKIDEESEIGSALNGVYFEEGAYQIVNLNENPSRAQLVFNKDFINHIDSGNIKDSNRKPVKTIIGTITTGIPISQDSEGAGTPISNPKNYRDIREYPFTISFNSAPPDIKNAMLQLTENGKGNYVLCFYLPKVKDTVHECDTKKIKIGSETYYFKDTGSGVNFYTDEECNTAADSNKINTSYGTGTLYPLHSGGVTFSGTAPSGYYPVYYFTETSMSADEIKYDIVLEDDFGLYKSVGVSSKGEKLTAVIIPNETDYIGTEDGYCEIQLTHNGQTITGDTVSGVTIYYTVEQGDNVVASGSGASGVKVKLPSGKKNYKIKAVARKPYYVESDESSQDSINVQRSPVYYVSQNGKSPENGALGTKASPFRTIQQAVDDITNQATDFGEVTNGYTINLLSNITPDESDTFENDDNHKQSMICITNSYKYTINGNGHTIDAKRDDTKKGRVIYVAGLPSITIENAILTGGNINRHGGAIYFGSHEKLILKNVEIKNNKASYGAGIELDTACDFISGSIHDNEATSGVAVNIQPQAILSLGDNSDISSIVNIYNNYNNNQETGSICVYGALTINQAKIFDNFIKASVSNPDIPNNVYLPNGKTITVGGNLSGCKIGVSTENTPSSGNTIQITTGYSTNNNGVPPSKIFKSDAGYGVIMDEIDNAEVVLAVGGGSIDVPSESYDNVKISVDKTVFLTKNTGNSLTVTSMVKPDSSYVDIPLNECTYSYELYNHGEKVNGIISTGSAKNIVNFNCASLPDETFELYVYLDYKGKKYQGVFPIEVYVGQGTPVTSSNEFTNALAAGGEIQLCKDTTVLRGTGYDNRITINKDCTIDGGGNELLMNYLLFDGGSGITVNFKNITLKSKDWLMLNINNNATLNLLEGTIIDFDNKNNNTHGIWAQNGGTLTMKNGVCIKNTNGGEAVYVTNNGCFIMNGGEICNNTGVAISGGTTSNIYINGGKIHHNKGDSIITASGWNGSNPYFEMNGGEIYSNIITSGTCNKSYDHSGGAIVFTGSRTSSSDIRFKITGGKIYNNYAYNNGGAICLIACNSSISGCEITNNVCGWHGAAIYNSNGDAGTLDYIGNCTIDSSAIIKNNYVNAGFDENNPVYDQGTEDNNVYSGNYNDYRN